ncbi:MAG: CynX/NimT family MFS transporter [Acidimicrobiales bacterium]
MAALARRLREDGRVAVARRALPRLVLLWLAGLDLRVTLLALPPLLPVVTRQLGLDQTAVGAITNLPVLLLGVAATLGAVVIARVGAPRAVVLGLAVAAAAGALRGVGSSVEVLFGLTFVMGLGVAVVQPAMPTLVREWLPGSIGTGTALYGNGLLVGEALSASLTLPLVLPATGSWPASLAVWSAPVAVTAVMAAVMARTGPPGLGAGPAPPAPPAPPAAPVVPPAAPGTPPAPGPASRRRSWPDWSDPRTWELGILQGGISVVYFATNTFLPGYLHVIGSPGLVGATLAALNVSQLPASLLLLLVARRLVGRRWPLVTLGLLLLAGAATLPFTPAPLLLAPVIVIGFTTSMLLLLTFALPALWGSADEVPRLSAGMFTVGYTLAFALPLLGGVASDLTGSARATLFPALLGAVLVTATAARLRHRDAAPG